MTRLRILMIKINNPKLINRLFGNDDFNSRKTVVLQRINYYIY